MIRTDDPALFVPFPDDDAVTLRPGWREVTICTPI